MVECVKGWNGGAKRADRKGGFALVLLDRSGAQPWKTWPWYFSRL